MKETQNEDGSWTLEWTTEEDPQTVVNLLSLATMWGVDPQSKEFNDKFVSLLEEAIEKDKVKHITELECHHDWKCTHAGSVVDHYECTLCGAEDMRST
jgi:hypothetical protein